MAGGGNRDFGSDRPKSPQADAAQQNMADVMKKAAALEQSKRAGQAGQGSDAGHPPAHPQGGGLDAGLVADARPSPKDAGRTAGVQDARADQGAQKTDRHAPLLTVGETLQRSLPEADRLHVASQMSSAQEFNDKRQFSVDRVRKLENYLTGNEHSKAGETGKCSQDLVWGIAAWQHANGLAVDGKLGDKTWDSLSDQAGWALYEPLQGQFQGQEGREVIPQDASEAAKYSFLEQLVKDRDGVWRDGQGQVNIVGIRGMQQGKQVKNTFGQHNDTFFLAWQDGQGKHVSEFPGSVDPGSRTPGDNLPGVAHIVDGSYTYRLGTHTHARADPKDLRSMANSLIDHDPSIKPFTGRTYEALRPAGDITVYRDINRDGIISNRDQQRGKLIEYRAPDTNIHYSPLNAVWSAGCQVVAGERNYINFMRIIKTSTNTTELPYTLVDASKVSALKKSR